jgi:hypothetical protein
MKAQVNNLNEACQKAGIKTIRRTDKKGKQIVYWEHNGKTILRPNVMYAHKTAMREFNIDLAEHEKV